MSSGGALRSGTFDRAFCRRADAPSDPQPGAAQALGVGAELLPDLQLPQPARALFPSDKLQIAAF